MQKWRAAGGKLGLYLGCHLHSHRGPDRDCALSLKAEMVNKALFLLFSEELLGSDTPRGMEVKAV